MSDHGLLGALKDAAANLALRTLERTLQELAARHGDDVRLDLPRRRVRLGDALLARTLRAAAAASDDLELDELAWDGEAYRCHVRHRGRGVTVRITPTEVSWADEHVTFVGTTPEAPVLDDAPVRTWLLGQLVWLLGGTAVGGLVLGPATPDGVRWDGARVTVRRPVAPPAGDAKLIAQAVTLRARLTHDDEGLWLTYEDWGVGALGAIVGLLMRAISLASGRAKAPTTDG